MMDAADRLLSIAARSRTSVGLCTCIASLLFGIRLSMSSRAHRLGLAVGHIDMTEDQLLANIMLSINFLVSLLKKQCVLRSSYHR